MAAEGLFSFQLIIEKEKGGLFASTLQCFVVDFIKNQAHFNTHIQFKVIYINDK